MGIPIGGDKRNRRRRRSYADYKKATARRTPPRSDPFRIVFYLVLIGVAFWVYRNADSLRAQYFEGIDLPGVSDRPFVSVPGAATGNPRRHACGKFPGATRYRGGGRLRERSVSARHRSVSASQLTLSQCRRVPHRSSADVDIRGRDTVRRHARSNPASRNGRRKRCHPREPQSPSRVRHPW